VREAFHVAKSSGARWCWHSLHLQKQNTWPTSPTRPRRCTSPRSGAFSPIPRRGRGRRAAGGGKRPIILGGRGVLWSGPRDAVISSPIAARLALQHAAARGLFSMDHSVRLGTPAATFTSWAGRCTSRGRRARGRHEPVYYVGGGHCWGKACKIQLDDAHAACAMGRRPPTSTSDRMPAPASRPSCRPRPEVGVATDGGAIRSKKLAHRIATEPRTRCRFRHPPGC